MVTQARSGAPNEAFGRSTMSRGTHSSAAVRSGTFCVRPLIFWPPRKLNAARKTYGSTKGTRTSVDADMLERSV